MHMMLSSDVTARFHLASSPLQPHHVPGDGGRGAGHGGCDGAPSALAAPHAARPRLDPHAAR